MPSSVLRHRDLRDMLAVVEVALDSSPSVGMPAERVVRRRFRWRVLRPRCRPATA
jgi:hypothetical protein